MESIPALTIEDVADIDNILNDYIQKSEADLAVVVDKGGNVLSQCGDLDVLDVTIIGALAAGSFAATKELAKRIGEVEFNALFHQGNGTHIFMSSVDEDNIMITVFGSDTTIGLVRFYSTSASKNLANVLQIFRSRANPGFNFEAEDLGGSQMFKENS
jgi:predicted regulator of Ras-like GTPase activity (Roadblock/LC7/MglB family)